MSNRQVTQSARLDNTHRRAFPHARLLIWAGLLLAMGACGRDSTDPLEGLGSPDAGVAGTSPGLGAATTGTATSAVGSQGTGGGQASDSGTGSPAAGGMTVVPESLSWSPDGSQLAFGTREGRFYLGSGPDFALVDGAALGPSSRPFARWSPAGDKVLLGGAWFDGTEVNTGLWLYTPDGARLVEMVPPSQVVSSVGGNTGAVHDAQWSPDGTRIAFPYRGEAWLATPSSVPERLTQLTDEPLPREGAMPFDGVRYVYWAPGGDRLALELSCDCGTPWSGAAVVPVGGDVPVASSAVSLLQDGMTVSGWSPDGRVLGQNAADWSPAAIVDGYAVSADNGGAENLTQSVEGRDPLLETSRGGEAGGGASDEAAEATVDQGPEATLYQTGPVQWGSDGTLLYETYSYADHPVPHRGFAVRRAGELVAERIGSAQSWFTAARLLADGRVAFVESGPGPVMPLLRAMVDEQEVGSLDGLATALSFSPDGSRLAVVEGLLTGTGGSVKVIELPVR